MLLKLHGVDKNLDVVFVSILFSLPVKVSLHSLLGVIQVNHSYCTVRE